MIPSYLHVGVHDELELLDAVLHGGAAGAVEADAARGERGEHGHGLHRVGGLGHVPVHHPAQLLAVAHHLVDPHDEVLLLRSLAQVDGSPPRQQLQQHHAERVHVALQRQLPCLEISRNSHLQWHGHGNGSWQAGTMMSSM